MTILRILTHLKNSSHKNESQFTLLVYSHASHLQLSRMDVVSLSPCTFVC